MKKINIISALFSILFIAPTVVMAQQTDLFAAAAEESKNEDKNTTNFAIATFKNSRLINGHSVETVGAGMMDFRVHHRFGFINTGLYELFGLDNATTFIGFDFGITDRFMIGVNRTGFQKQMEGFAKYKLLRQSTGKVNMPVSVTLVAATTVKTIKDTDPTKPRTTADKTSYTFQALLARKINDKTSIQLMPTMVHYNLVPNVGDANDRFSLGFGGRQKVSKRISINAEYYYQLNKWNGYKNSLAVGVDIETGGHVFQLHFTNSTGMTAPTYIHETTGDWGNGDIHFGFNVSRVFRIAKKKNAF